MPTDIEKITQMIKDNQIDRQEKHTELANHIDKINNRLDGVVTYKVFFWAMGIVVVVFGWIITTNLSLNTQLQSSLTNQNQILVELAKIQNDVGWIKLQVK